MRKRKYKRGRRPTDEEVAEINRLMADGLMEEMSQQDISAYGLSVMSGIDHYTVQRILRGRGSAWWKVEHLKRLLRKG